jgi:hypothetical protein
MKIPIFYVTYAGAPVDLKRSGRMLLQTTMEQATKFDNETEALFAIAQTNLPKEHFRVRNANEE